MNIFALEYTVLGIVLLVSGSHFLRTIVFRKQRSRSLGTKKTGLKTPPQIIRSNNESRESSYS